MSQRNPNWSRDELILALDLYFQLESSEITKSNPRIIELSNILRNLHVHAEDDIYDKERFRNPNGVTLKLANLEALDPNYTGSGMSSYSKGDEAIFKEFFDKQHELHRLATNIREAAQIIPEITNTEEPEEDAEAKEGKILFKLHKYRERDRSLVDKKKKQQLKKYGRLACEVCGFDFKEKYGELGEGFIECHHKTPLAELNAESKTTLNDLALVCANCHRMLHRSISSIGVEDLRGLV